MGLTNEQIQAFQDKGFLVIRNFYDTTTIAAISDWLDALSNKPPGKSEDAMYFEKSPFTGENMLVRVEHFLGDHNPDVTRLLLSDNTIECLTDLLGETPVLFKDKVNYKLPGCRPDKLHQDQAAGWGTYSDYYISMGIIIDPNRIDNAAMSFLCSGNYEKKLMTEEWQPITEDDPPYQPEDEYMVLEADPGDVIFFDSYLPHGSPANNSNRQRRNLFLTFNRQSDGQLRDQYYADKWKNYPPNDLEHIRTKESFRV